MKIINKISVGLLGASLGLIGAGHAIAQDAEAASLEEILVTGRKREESLTDVPVSISVFNASMLAEAGIANQQDLFDATPGLSFDTATGDRNSSQPAVRGVQSNEIATTQQKVNSFIDGLPMLGQVGSLTFSGIDQVEIYRGPQSAAFGRSTFAGAINYVTADATEEFEGMVSGKLSDLGGNEIGVAISGPLTDSLGYRLSYVHDELTGPDEWTASDGTEMGTQETGTFSAKLNFEVSDSVYGEVMYTRVDQEDGAAAQWTLNATDCAGDSGIYLNNMGARTELFSGEWDCDISTDSISRNHDVLGSFVDAYDPANFGGMTLDAYLAQTDMGGVTYEQILLGQTVDPFAITERDRYQGEINFEFGDSLLTLLGMQNSEFYQRWNDSDGNDTIAVITAGMLGMNVGSMSDPTDIEETYLEARWASPEDQRLRYTLSASHYEYDFLTNVYFNYGALAYGLVNETTGEDVSPARNLIISNSTSNQGAAFGIQYDLTDRTTLSVEGRYQTDENCGADEVNSLSACTTTKSFAPRVAINTALTEDSSVYFQYSQGTNPAGINIAYANPFFVEALQIANGSIAVPGLAPDGVSVPSNAGTIYDGADGVHFPTVSYSADIYDSYDEEVLTNYEIGYKGSFMDRRGNITAALYFMDWKDLVSAGNLGWNDDSSVAGGDAYDGWDIDGYWDAYDGTRTFYNTGDAEFYGLEIASSFAIDEMWTVGGNIALTSSRYTDYCSVNGSNYTTINTPPFTAAFDILTPEADGVESNCASVDGNNMPRTSKVKGSLDVTASLPNEIFGMRTSIRADLRHTGKSFQDDFNMIEVAAVTTMNLSANMRNDDGLSVRLFVNNLTDEDYPQNIGISNYYTQNANSAIAPTQDASWSVTPRRPREVGLTVGYEF